MIDNDEKMNAVEYNALRNLVTRKARREKAVFHSEYTITHLKDLPRVNQLELFNALIMELACT